MSRQKGKKNTAKEIVEKIIKEHNEGVTVKELSGI